MKLALVALAAMVLADSPQAHRVTIDALVVDSRGRTVETLKASDFEIREDGTVRSVDEVRFVRDQARLFAIYLDEYHVSSGDASERVRRALTTFIDESMGPNDLVAVLKPLDSLLKIQLTTDHAAARQLVAGFEGRSGDYSPRSEYERQLIAGEPARVDAARSQVLWSALDALATTLGTYPAQRKSLIVASEPFTMPPRRRGQLSLASIDSAIRASNRFNVSMYLLDPSEEPSGAVDQPLRRLSAETNGRVLTGDLTAGLRRLDADARGYYLFTYRSDHPADGRFHDVQLRLLRASAGEVRARKGFYDVSPDEAMLARMNEPKPVKPPEPAPHASTSIRPWFGVSRGDDGLRVTFVWEPAAPVPGDRGDRVRHVASHLTLKALTTDGTILFEGPVAPTGAGAIDEPGVTPSRISFATPAGRVKLRMAIQDAAGQPLDSDVRDLVIRDLKGPVSVGTPEIVLARNARELRTVEAQASAPVVSREFSRAEELLVRVPVYAGDAHADVTAHLLGRSGQVMRQLPTAPHGALRGVEAFTLPLAGLAVGEYTIEVTAQTDRGEASDRVTFRVTS